MKKLVPKFNDDFVALMQVTFFSVYSPFSKISGIKV